jgi:hypothetical protein
MPNDADAPIIPYTRAENWIFGAVFLVVFLCILLRIVLA